MAAVKSKDTTPEMIVRRLVHALGYRYRLHDASLPGTPDLVFRRRRKVIIVNGCFWHRHRGCKNCTTPTNNRKFWVEKLEGNAARDKRNRLALRKLGWKTFVIWECQIENRQRLENTLTQFVATFDSSK